MAILSELIDNQGDSSKVTISNVVEESEEKLFKSKIKMQ